MTNQKKKLKNFGYDPNQHGGLDFVSAKLTPKLFSDPDYFKSVFVSGGDAEREHEEFVKNEKEKFNKKIVVASK